MYVLPPGAQPPRPPRTAPPAARCLRLLAAVLLAGAVAPRALPAQGAPIIVVANRVFRPTAVLQPHIRYVVAADSNDERLIIRDLGIPPVTFGGIVRIEGIQPGARSFESRPWPDTAIFERDGRVLMRLADHAERPPITVEVFGARTAIGGRIVITAPGMPPGRALLVTIGPADIYETSLRQTGFGVRDRLRVDDRGGMAYLADSASGPTTVAIGFGRNTAGRIQADAADVLVIRDFGGEAGRERRLLGALTFAIDPSRDDAGLARAEIIFGVGNSEGQAAQAARDAASEAPSATPPVPPLRITTPSAQVNMVLRQLFAAAGWMLNWDVLNNERTIAASSSRPAVRIHDAWLGSVVALQRGDSAAVCGSYRLVRRASGEGPTRIEVVPRLGSRGRYLAASDSTDTNADASAVLLAHACYMAARSEPFLRAELPYLGSAAARAAREAPGPLAADALERLAELEDELVRLVNAPPSGRGDSLREEAERLSPSAAAPPPDALWRLITTDAARGVNRDYGRISTNAEEGGLAMSAAGTFLDLVGGELFGITEALDRVGVAPALDGIDDNFTWTLDGWLLGGGDTLGITYRPADRQAVLRLSASRRRRLVLRFPWLTADACVTVRRGDDIERLRPVAQADGSVYVDIRGTFDRAQITVVPVACVG